MREICLSQIDLAARWRISPRTLERWRWTGEGPSFMKLGGRVIYRLEDVLAFENQELRDLEEIKAGRCMNRPGFTGEFLVQ
ncbi:helix-turn-helix transcriptional regulator [Paracoccus yeei]